MFGVHASSGTRPKAELDLVMAAVCGPVDPLAPKVSVPIVVEFEMLLDPRLQLASEDTLYPASVMSASQFCMAEASSRMELASVKALPSTAPSFDAKVLLVIVPPFHAAMAPVLLGAVFPWNVLFVTVNVPVPEQSPTSSAPPSSLELPVNVDCVTITLPVRSPSPIHASPASIAPPWSGAELSEKVSSFTVTVPNRGQECRHLTR